MIHFDSSFVIDMLRELDRERPGAALEFMESLDEREVLGVSVHVLCEVRIGAELSPNVVRAHERIDELMAGMYISYPDERFAPAYARLSAVTRRARTRVPPMDLLIATAALIDDAQLVTRNVKDFSRVPGLRVLGY